MMEEKEYRKNVLEHFQKIMHKIDAVDPDVIEADLGQGTLTLSCSDGSKTILSQQPSVRQIWLAAAAQGKAMHFTWDPQKTKWLDDKGSGVDLLAFLTRTLQETSGLVLKFE